ncbi:hypothetical protein HCB27_14320 [Listeria booriae]|uniref:Uncharacterized protein n=1 Tax=Listeria booriae TaxID=1552123 RepID=A0A7X1D9V0_9LIST|nr:hypothetical protein [Listeria booriae]MBC2177776.1 hypothetical protein [Listeria booriae]MBC2177803.1 hypothetical protein [Listeria booriae]
MKRIFASIMIVAVLSVSFIGFSGVGLDNKVEAASQNVGSLDAFRVHYNGKSANLSVSGWHAATGVVWAHYSYIFVMNYNTGLEIARFKATQTNRPDVYRVYPNISISNQSGFSGSMNFNPFDSRWYNQRIYIMHRYSLNSNGERSVSDYHFPSNGGVWTSN